MAYQPLSEIIVEWSSENTQWTEIERLLAQEGPVALANYLSAKYFNFLAVRFKRYCPQLDDLGAHELASDVMYKLIKNDYRAIIGLDRKRGPLRGLLSKMIRNRLYEKNQRRQEFQILIENLDNEEIDNWINIYLDLQESLEKLEQERPRLHQVFIFYYIQGKSLFEIEKLIGVNANAVKQRLYAARCCLKEWLKDYS